MKIGVGVYGTNGHQIQCALENHSQARLAAVAFFPREWIPAALRDDPSIRHYSTLSEMLDDDQVQVVSLCSPRRKDQAADAIDCLRAGKHVFAEKPCALTEKELDMLIETANGTDVLFREMGGTAFVQPFLAMRELILAGTIGTVVQVIAQKSYPYFDARPQDEEIDGGLLCQAGVHAMRFIEHVACQRISEIHALETSLGNPKDGELRMAVSYMMRLDNGGLASAVANYLNPKQGFGRWGNDHLRIFGTLGFVEATDDGTKTRLVLGDRDCGSIDTSSPSRSHFDMFLDEVSGIAPMPLSLEDELHPTRMVIRAKASAGTK